MRRFSNFVRLFSVSTILVLGLLLPFATAFGASTRLVDPAGADTGDCISSACATINYAIGQADPGDTIDVAAGTYSELVTVNKSLVINGEQAGVDARTRTSVPESIVNGNSGSSSFYVTADDVTINGFTAQGQTNAAQFGAGIVLTPGTSGAQILNNIVRDNVVGLYLANDSATAQAVVHQNLFRDNDEAGPAAGTGIYTDATVSGATLTNILIDDNAFSGTNFTFAINLQNATLATVTDNAFLDGNGNRFSNVDNSAFNNNSLSGVLAVPPASFQTNGLAVTNGSDNVEIDGNTFTNRLAGAIGVTIGASNLTITDNIVSQDVTPFNGATRNMILVSRVSGTSLIARNSVTLSGTMPTGANIHAFEISGSGSATNAGTYNFTQNTLNGGSVEPGTTNADSAGLKIFGSAHGNSVINVTENVITGFANGIVGENFQSTTSFPQMTIFENSLAGNTAKGFTRGPVGTFGTINMSANWWGSNVEATVNGYISGTGVDFTPYLNTGTDTSVDPGFQGDFSYLNVTALGAQSGTTGRIQEGVNLVDGSTVNVGAGTFDEQVVITESMTLQGQGNTTIIQPSSAAVLTSVYTTGTQAGAFFNGDTIASIIDVRNVGAAGVTIQDLKVDGELVVTQPAGATRFSGITYGETGGLIDQVTVEETRNIVPASVRSYSIWVDAVGDTALDVDVSHSSALLYGRNGINGRGDDLNIDITDNTITGPGTVGPSQVPNGVLIISGATGTVTGNTITANHYTGAEFLGSGVLLFQAGDNIAISENDVSDVDDAVLINATDLASVTDNDLSGNAKGVRIEAGDAANNTITGNTIDNNTLFGFDLSNTVGTGNMASNNSITGNGAGVMNADTDLFDAECNWWGAADGPSGEGSGTGDTVSTNVDFEPWLESAVLTGVCTGVPVCATPPFTDVPVDHPFCAEIQWVKDEGISTGFDDGTYRPTLVVTRQAMAAFLARLADATLTTCSTPPFTDVPIDHPFCPEIKWMLAEGISTGFGDGTYRPTIAVTRQAMSAFLARLADATLTPCTTPPFTDVPISHPFCQEIKWMLENGISTGFDDGTYRPSVNVTRQAMAAFLVRTSPLLN